MTTTTNESATTETPVWFITGCSTGFGRELAKHVLELGYRENEQFVIGVMSSSEQKMKRDIRCAVTWSGWRPAGTKSEAE